MPFSVFTIWLLLVWGAGWLAFPLALRGLGHALPDGGLAVGRIGFLVVWAVVAFWLGHAGVSVAHCAWIYVFLGFASLVLWWNDRRLITREWKARRRTLLSVEAAFLGVFLVFWTLRGFWSDTSGTNGEKGMDSVLIATLSRAQQLPPSNPYAAGAKLESYYILGHLETALLTRATGTTTRWSYDLMCATLPALCVSALFSLGAALTRKLNGGLFVSATVLGLGTLQPLLQWLHPERFPSKGFLGLDFFAVSRVLPYAINEFPWFTFNQADLHAHYFDFPIQIALMTLAWSLYRARRESQRLMILGACSVGLGAEILTNTWDFPAFALLIVLSFALAPHLDNEPLTLWPRRTGWLVLALAAAVAVALPYLLRINTAARGPSFLTQPNTPLREWLLMWGPILAAWWAFSATWLFRSNRRARLTIGALGAFVLLAAWLGQSDWGFPAGLEVQPVPTSESLSTWFAALNPARLAIPLIVGCAWLAVAGLKRGRGSLRFVLILALAGLFALGWSQTLWAGFLGDPKFPAPTDSKQQDTIFKFGLQAWILWGTAASAGAFFSLRRWPLALRLAFVPLLVVMAISSLVDTVGRARGFDRSQRQNWDAWAHLSPAEQQAARWLELHTLPGENILEAEQKEGGDFSQSPRFTHATGIPTIIGPSAHAFYWSPSALRPKREPDESADEFLARRAGLQSNEVAWRKTQARTAYMTHNSAKRLSILKHYGVRFVVWSELERKQYGEASRAHLRHDLRLIARFGFEKGADESHRVEIWKVP